VFKPSGSPGTAPAALRGSRSEEYELQRVLEEEIVREMEREQALAQVGGLSLALSGSALLVPPACGPLLPLVRTRSRPLPDSGLTARRGAC
jgi:hypothetical protein